VVIIAEIELMRGDCIELMKNIPDKSIDMVLCDLQYGTTARNKWDIVIPFETLWGHYDRIVKIGGAIVLFSQMPFTIDVVNSNRDNFRYEWVWEKGNASGFLNANRMPLKAHENILVFYKKLPTYNPQKTDGKPYQATRRGVCTNYNEIQNIPTVNEDGKRYPRDVIKFSKETGFHPTQKPVDLCEYLINTYTNPGDLVLDNCMGSGTTGVACKNLNRNFIGIELNEEYFEIARERIESA